MGALVPYVAVGVIKDLAPPCSLCFPLDPQTIAATPQMLSRVCLRHFPAPEAHTGTGPHVCGTGRSLALNGSESSSLKPWCAAPHRGGLSATFPCWHILLLPPPSPQLPGQGAAGRPWLSPHVLQPHSRLSAGTGVQCPSDPATLTAGVREGRHVRAVLVRSRDSPPAGKELWPHRRAPLRLAAQAGQCWPSGLAALQLKHPLRSTARHDPGPVPRQGTERSHF